MSGPPRARLLRAAQAGEAIPTSPARLVSKAVFEAGQTADALLEAARREAEAVRAEARAQADAMKGEVAERAGAAAAGEVARLIELLSHTRAEMVRQAEPQLIDLATAIAERMLNRELNLNPQAVAELVAAALVEARSPWAGPDVTVRIHPLDAEPIAHYDVELSSLLADGQTLRLEPDPTVPRFGCRIETAAGTVDGTLATQLELLRQALRKAHASRQSTDAREAAGE